VQSSGLRSVDRGLGDPERVEWGHEENDPDSGLDEFRMRRGAGFGRAGSEGGRRRPMVAPRRDCG
jgi:hypothetical protein